MPDQHPDLTPARQLAGAHEPARGHRPMAMLSHIPARRAMRLGAVAAGVVLQGLMLAPLFAWTHPMPDRAVPLQVDLATLPPPEPVAGRPPDETPPEPAQLPVPAPPATPEPVRQVAPEPPISPPQVVSPTAPPPVQPAPRPAVHHPPAARPASKPPPAPVAAASRPESPAPAATIEAAAATGSATAERQAEDLLRGRIREAIQAASRCPTAARMMGLAGRAGVSFAYRDGAIVGAVQLVRSTGTDLLDAAALAAVREAHYPQATPEVGGRVLRLLIWVEEACAA